MEEFVVIGEHNGNDLSTMPDYDNYLADGDIGQVRLYMSEPATPEQLASLQNKLIADGVVLTDNITQVANMVVIPFLKQNPPPVTPFGAGVISSSTLLLIGVGVAAVMVIGSLLGWQVITAIREGVPTWVWWVGGAAMLYLILIPSKDGGGQAPTIRIVNESPHYDRPSSGRAVMRTYSNPKRRK